VPEGYPGQDYGNLLRRTRAADIGVINIRVLAGGALTGTEVRHPLGMPSVEPIGSGSNYAADVRRAQRLQTLVQEGYANSLVDLALRFAISHPAIGTVLVGYSTLEHLELAAAAINKGPLAPRPCSTLRRCRIASLARPDSTMTQPASRRHRDLSVCPAKPALAPFLNGIDGRHPSGHGGDANGIEAGV